jgi:hypothetical protein
MHHDCSPRMILSTTDTIYLDLNSVKIYLKIDMCVRTRRLGAWGAETPA